MRTIDSTTILEKNKEENQPIFLYIIENYNGASANLYYTAYDVNVVYNGNTYIRFPISHAPVSENAEGIIDAVEITIANVSLVIQEYLEIYKWKGLKVRIVEVWTNQLSDPDAYLESIFYIDKFRTDARNAYFTCTSKFDALDVYLPREVYLRHHCQLEFKSAECGYSGGETTCNLTKARCKELNNYDRFGGTPSIPVGRMYFA